MRGAVLLLCPIVLLGANVRQSVRFVEDTRSSATSFIGETGQNHIRINQTGWYLNDHVGLRFAGTVSEPRLEGLEPGPPASFFSGNDPRAWVHAVRTFARIRERNVYPGVDIEYHASASGSIEYDFVVDPHVDSRRISFVWTGNEPLKLNSDGSLILPAGEMKLATPIAYQMVRGQRVIVPCRYRVSGNRIRFELGSYDRSRVLLIDPTLLFVRLIEGYTPQALTTDQEFSVI